MLVLEGKKKYFFYLIFFVFLTTYQFHQDYIFPIFKIKKVIFLNSKNLEESIKNNLSNYLLSKNMFNIDNEKVMFFFKKSKWTSSYKIKKKYPNEILIHVEEYKPIAIYKKKGKFFIINNSFLVTNKDLGKDHSLNFIYIEGEYAHQNLKKIYKEIIKYNFFNIIESIRFLKLDRLEIYLKNNIIVKLGNYNLTKQLNTLEKIINTKDKLKIIDLRNEGIVFIL